MTLDTIILVWAVLKFIFLARVQRFVIVFDTLFLAQNETINIKWNCNP